VTWKPLSRSKGQRLRSPGRFTQRGLNAQGGCSGQRGNVFGVGNYYYVASARRRARRLGAHGGRRGAGAYCVATRTACYSSCSTYSSTYYLSGVYWVLSPSVPMDDIRVPTVTQLSAISVDCCYAPPLRPGALNDDAHLTSVCLASVCHVYRA